MANQNTCSNCAHWRVTNNTSLRIAEQIVGECRGGTPCSDFKWPRTYANQGCQMHRHATGMAFATGKARPENKDQGPGAGEQRQAENTLFDEGAGSAKSSGQPERDGGPAAAVDAAAPQITAVTGPESSPIQARAPGADGTARNVSRPAPRRTSKP